MKLKITALLAVLLFAFAAVAQTPSAQKSEAAEAHNKAQSKEELLKYMQQTRENFLNSVKGLSEAQLKFKPAPDKWSVMEVSEHIALSEDYLGGSTMKMMSAPASDKKAEMYGKED